MTQKNSVMADESATSARGLQNETAWLLDLVSFFKTGETIAMNKEDEKPSRAPATQAKPARAAVAGARGGS